MKEETKQMRFHVRSLQRSLLIKQTDLIIACNIIRSPIRLKEEVIFKVRPYIISKITSYLVIAPDTATSASTRKITKVIHCTI